MIFTNEMNTQGKKTESKRPLIIPPIDQFQPINMNTPSYSIELTKIAKDNSDSSAILVKNRVDSI